MSVWSALTQVAAQVDAPKSIRDASIPLTNSAVQNIFNVILALAGAVAVAFIVFGGIKYSLSQGDQNDVKAAKDTILYAIIGIVVVVIAFMLVNFVVGKF